MGLEPFAWWCLNYVIIPVVAGAILVFLTHQVLLLYWDLRDQRQVRRSRRELYERMHRELRDQLRKPADPDEEEQPPGQ